MLRMTGWYLGMLDLSIIDYPGSIPSYLMSVAGPNSEIAVGRAALQRRARLRSYLMVKNEVSSRCRRFHDSRIALID